MIIEPHWNTYVPDPSPKSVEVLNGSPLPGAPLFTGTPACEGLWSTFDPPVNGEGSAGDPEPLGDRSEHAT